MRHRSPKVGCLIRRHSFAKRPISYIGRTINCTCTICKGRPLAPLRRRSAGLFFPAIIRCLPASRAAPSPIPGCIPRSCPPASKRRIFGTLAFTNHYRGVMRLRLPRLISVSSVPQSSLCCSIDRHLQLSLSRKLLSVAPQPFTKHQEYRPVAVPLSLHLPAQAASEAMATTTTAAGPPPLVPEEGDKDLFSGFANTISSLFRSGHHKWGFLVYRTSYDDDEAWQRFMDILTRNTEVSLRKAGKLQRLQPYLYWTAMEDRTAFDGASKDAIRDHFRDWVNTRSVERDGPGADHEDLARYSPRYRVCLYVDKIAMESASMELFPNPYGLEVYQVNGRVVLIDAQFGQHLEGPHELNEYELQEIADGEYTMEDVEDDEGEYEPIEDRTTYDVGWMYCQLEYVSSAYERLSEAADEWTEMYMRPPETFPSLL
jgi:hypothetical protein